MFATSRCHAKPLLMASQFHQIQRPGQSTSFFFGRKQEKHCKVGTSHFIHLKHHSPLNKSKPHDIINIKCFEPTFVRSKLTRPTINTSFQFQCSETANVCCTGPTASKASPNTSNNWCPPRKDHLKTMKFYFILLRAVSSKQRVEQTQHHLKILHHCLLFFIFLLARHVLPSTESEALSNHSTSYILIHTCMYVNEKYNYTSSITIHIVYVIYTLK